MTDDRRDERDSIDALLRTAFEGEPVPGLSPGFEARLGRRLSTEGLASAAGRGTRRLSARDCWLLRGYWLLAAACSLAMVWETDLAPMPRAVPWPALLALAVTAAGLALPFLALRRAGGSVLGVLRRALTAGGS